MIVSEDAVMKSHIKKHQHFFILMLLPSDALVMVVVMESPLMTSRKKSAGLLCGSQR